MIENCEICGKEMREEEIYHIEYFIGHLKCFIRAINFYIKTQKNLKECRDFFLKCEGLK